MDISQWKSAYRGAASEGRANRWRSPSLGLIGTALLHALVLHTAILGTRASKVRPPETQGVGATRIKSLAEPTEELILVELSSVNPGAQSLQEDLASAGASLSTLHVTLISPDSLPHVVVPKDQIDDRSRTEAKIDSGDPATRALLFGRYSGQIQARIDRAWRRPRSPIAVDESPPTATNEPQGDFRCQVRILQDAHGAVQEVQILSCNGSISWQQSLVRGILSASPLPAPPDPAVFTRSLTMVFEGHPYSPSDSLDGYEGD